MPAPDWRNAAFMTCDTLARRFCWYKEYLRGWWWMFWVTQIGLTMNTYAHVIPEMRKEAAERMEELIRD